MKRNILALLAFVSVSAFAQHVDPEKRFGATEEDSINCVNNISNYTVNFKNKSYEVAYPYWKEVFTNFPLASVNVYYNGPTLLKQLIATAKDEQKRNDYINELMAVYDQQLKYLDILQQFTKTKMTRGYILGKKAMDYIKYIPNADTNTAYDMLSESVGLEKGVSEYYVTQQFMKYSAMKYKNDPAAHGEQIIQDYLDASVYIVEVLDKYHENIENYNKKYAELQDPRDSIKAVQTGKQIDQARISRSNVDAYFINCGAASCEDLNRIYLENLEAHKSDLEYLNKVISVMSMLKCTEQDAYLTASEYALAIEPTSKAAMGCGYRYYKRGEIDKALELFDQAIELETSITTKAELCYKVGAVYFSQKQYAKARTYAQKAIALNSKFGDPYILIAQCYAASPNWSDDNIKNGCTYFAAIDKLQRAKNVDPTAKKEADKLIASYSTYTPSKEDLFMRGLTSGTKVTIGGWINETTTIR